MGKDKKKIDTSGFREAIAIYVELIYGIIDDSYNYKKTNKYQSNNNSTSNIFKNNSLI